MDEIYVNTFYLLITVPSQEDHIKEKRYHKWIYKNKFKKVAASILLVQHFLLVFGELDRYGGWGVTKAYSRVQ